MKRAFTLIEVTVVIVIILILAALLFPILATRHDTPPKKYLCQSNLKQIGLGLLQYNQDYDEFFPPARVTSTTGWADVAQPYLKSWQLFHCAATPDSTPPPIDYFYNRRLSRLPLKNLTEPAFTILCGDGQDDAPTWNSITQLPRTWSQTTESPARRHLDTANYLFADGHVKALPPTKITNISPKTKDPTFAVR